MQYKTIHQPSMHDKDQLEIESLYHQIQQIPNLKMLTEIKEYIIYFSNN